ncbi:hypothetical protein B0T26DRAFT_652199, partial [Lasiosphaeria miniovina]
MASLIPPGMDLCMLPAAIAPPGETYNFENPESLAAATAALDILLLILTYLFAGARLWQNRHRWRMSDYMTMVSLAIYTGLTGIFMSLHQYNRHQWDVPLCWFNGHYMKTLYAEILLFGATQFFSKAAIFLLFRELFGISVTMRRAVWVGIAASFVVYVSFIPVASYFMAPKMGHTWDALPFEMESGIALQSWGIAIGASTVLLDIYIFFLPLPVLSHLNLTRSRRMRLIAVFCTALFGVAASVLALVYRVKLFLSSDDNTWGQALIAICNQVENSVAIIVGSGPAFSAFLRAHVMGISDGSWWTKARSMLRST